MPDLSITSPDLRARLARYAQRHPRRYLLLHAVVALAVVLALVAAFAAIADAVPENGRMVWFDHALTAFIQAHDTEWGETIFLWISYLGPPIVDVAIVIGAGWYAKRRDWLRVGTVLASGAGGIILCHILKAIFHRGRPEVATEFISRTSWSFPSGHAMETVTTYGILLVLATERIPSDARRRLLRWSTIIVIALVGFSRIYLGVHYLSDVVAGWLAGGAWLIASISGYHVARRAGVGLPPTATNAERISRP